jgi:hypothetical protein
VEPCADSAGGSPHFAPGASERVYERSVRGSPKCWNTSQERKEERPSNASRLRQVANSVSCTRSSAS